MRSHGCLKTQGLLLVVVVLDQAGLELGAAPPRLHISPALRGGASEGAGSGEAGVTHALVEPGSATRVSFGDFPSARPAKRRRDGATAKQESAGLREITGEKDDYEELFKDLHTPERPGFLESLPKLPQYEPDSDELADDDVCRPCAWLSLPPPSLARPRFCGEPTRSGV
jgi:hypothetical protein